VVYLRALREYPSTRRLVGSLTCRWGYGDQFVDEPWGPDGARLNTGVEVSTIRRGSIIVREGRDEERMSGVRSIARCLEQKP